MRLTFTTLLLLLLPACGFTPLYGEHSGDAGAPQLAAIQLQPVEAHDARNSQTLYTRLVKLLKPAEGKYVTPQYILHITLEKSQTGQVVEQNRQITRYKVTMTAHYKLLENTTRTLIDEGNLRREGGYDAVSSEYATYISQVDAEKRILRELAEDFKLQMVSSLVRHKEGGL